VFDEEGALARLEGFASLFGPAFYGLSVNNELISLARVDGLDADENWPTPQGPVRQFEPPGGLRWRVVRD